MAKRLEPTEKQRRFLESRGLIVPPTRKVASRLIYFILRGNGTVGRTVGARMAIVKNAQKLIGKRVRSKKFKATGVVRYVLPLSAADAQAWRDAIPNANVGAMQVVVTWEDHKSHGGPCWYSSLEVINEQVEGA